MTHSSVHSKSFHLLINRKKGLHLFADRDMNLHFLGISRRLQVVNSFNLIGVNLNPSVSDYIA